MHSSTSVGLVAIIKFRSRSGPARGLEDLEPAIDDWLGEGRSTRVCHVYVGDVAEPQLTFSLFDLESGGLGLKPRVVGGVVWVDNVKVVEIPQLSYAGPPRPMPAYAPGNC